MKVIVDTSIFVHFIKYGDISLNELLENDQVLIHPFVLLEISLGGSLKNKILHSLLSSLPQVKNPSTEAIDSFIQSKKIWTYGIGLVDSIILCSAIEEGAKLYTLDKKLQKAASALKVKF